MSKPIEPGDIILKCVGTTMPVKIRVLQALEDKDVFLVEQVADDKKEDKDKKGQLRTCIRERERVQRLDWIRSANQWCYDTATLKRKNKVASVVDMASR